MGTRRERKEEKGRRKGEIQKTEKKE